MENRPNRTCCLEELRRRIARFEMPRANAPPPVTSGCLPLDEFLPEKGFRRGTLIEWLSAGEGTGACTLALLTARQVCQNGGVLVVMDRRHDFCPPAAIRCGIRPEQFVVIQAENAADNDWAMDQVLRSRAVAAVLAWPEKIDGRTFRRWQLAVEQGGGLGLLLRPATARADPSWADVRLLVEPRRSAARSHTRLLRMIFLRCRGGTDGHSVDVELDDETYRVHPVAGRDRHVAQGASPRSG